MFLRALVFLLLALNLGAAVWQLSARRGEPAPARTALAAVAPLELLSEREGPPAAGAELALAPSGPGSRLDEACGSLGPFDNQADTRSVLNALAPAVTRIRIREEQTRRTRGYWVHLPAAASREAALASARRLAELGVRDYYVVTAGEAQNTVSLGLFREKANAERRQAEIVALGLAPQTNERSEELPVYWLDFALADPAARPDTGTLPEPAHGLAIQGSVCPP